MSKLLLGPFFGVDNDKILGLGSIFSPHVKCPLCIYKYKVHTWDFLFPKSERFKTPV